MALSTSMSKARSEMVLAEATNTYIHASSPRNCESGFVKKPASQRDTFVAGVALPEAVRAKVQSLRNAKLVGTQPGERTASREKERVPDRNGPETATEEELAWLSRMEAIKGRVQAQDRRLEAASQTLQATLTGLESDTSKLEGEAEMWKNHRLVWHGGKAAIRVQALQYEGRRRVLARLKISSRSIAPDGKPWGRQRFTNLVQDWGKTRWQRLNIQQRRELMEGVDHDFLGFLEKDAQIMDTPSAKMSAYRIGSDMPWVEKAYMMEAIDNLPEAVRAGGRNAYRLIIGDGRSWEAERKLVRAKLAASGW